MQIPQPDGEVSVVWETVSRCSPCDCDTGGAHTTMCSPEDGQCLSLPNIICRRCLDPAPGYVLPPLDYILYEAKLATPLHRGCSPSFTNTPSSSSLFCCSVSSFNSLMDKLIHPLEETQTGLLTLTSRVKKQTKIYRRSRTSSSAVLSSSSCRDRTHVNH